MKHNWKHSVFKNQTKEKNALDSLNCDFSYCKYKATKIVYMIAGGKKYNKKYYVKDLHIHTHTRLQLNYSHICIHI